MYPFPTTEYISRSSLRISLPKYYVIEMQMSVSTKLSLESTRKRTFDRDTLPETFELKIYISDRADLCPRSSTTQTSKWYVLKGPNRFTTCGPIGSRVTYACPWGDLPQVSR